MSDIMERIGASFRQQGMMRTIGARLVGLEEGEVRIEAEVMPATSQHHGAGHAGLTFSLADSAAGYAALTTMPEGYDVVTSEFRISLLAPAKGRLEAIGRVIRPGQRLVAVASDVWGDGDGTRVHVATALGTMIPLAPRD